jgi:uncharacterized membrane protein YfcA
LVLPSLIAVLVGAQLSQYVSPRMLKLIAGIGFVAIGIWSRTMFAQARTGFPDTVPFQATRQPLPRFLDWL